MGSAVKIPPLPPGFVLDGAQPDALPPLPAGFKLDAPPLTPEQQKAKDTGYADQSSKLKAVADVWKPDFAKIGEEFWNQVNPVEAARGLADLGAHPIETGTGMLNAQGELAIKAKDAMKRGDYVEGVRHALNYMIPVLGTGIDRAGDLAQKGELSRAAGATAGIAANVVAPELINKVPVPTVVKEAAQKTSERLYQSALKPSTAMEPAKRADIIKTGVEGGIPVSEKGFEQIHQQIKDLNAQIDATIARNPSATIAPNRVASRLNDTAKTFRNQAAPSSDLKIISEVGNDFLESHGGKPLTATETQNLKKGTYKQIGSRAYGDVKTAQIEAEKALARGMKEELETPFPELKSLNAQEGKFYNLEPVLARAIGRISNHELLGIGTPIAAGATAAVTGSAKAATVVATIKAVIDNPAVKSRLAIMINKGSRGKLTISQTNARLAAYSNALGQALEKSNQGDDGQ